MSLPSRVMASWLKIDSACGIASNTLDAARFFQDSQLSSSHNENCSLVVKVYDEYQIQIQIRVQAAKLMQIFSIKSIHTATPFLEAEKHVLWKYLKLEKLCN